MRSFACAAFIAPIALASIAMAQTPSATRSSATDSTAVPSADAEPSPTSSAKPFAGATGYSYAATPTPTPAIAQRAQRTRGRTAHANAADAEARMAGFETLGDGSTRLFVQLSRTVAYETKPGRATIAYVLKGAHVDRRNNQNPLVTIHFNTPVASARLVPHGRDVWLVVDLRANVTPTATMEAGGDGATLHVVFPKGDYLPKEPSAPLSMKPSEDSTAPGAP